MADETSTDEIVLAPLNEREQQQFAELQKRFNLTEVTKLFPLADSLQQVDGLLEKAAEETQVPEIQLLVRQFQKILGTYRTSLRGKMNFLVPESGNR